jgi:hypothetical protein
VIDHIAARLDGAMTRGTAAFGADPPVLPPEQARS